MRFQASAMQAVGASVLVACSAGEMLCCCCEWRRGRGRGRRRKHRRGCRGNGLCLGRVAALVDQQGPADDGEARCRAGGCGERSGCAVAATRTHSGGMRRAGANIRDSVESAGLSDTGSNGSGPQEGAWMEIRQLQLVAGVEIRGARQERATGPRAAPTTSH
jgi:hypothetical protein